MFFGKGFKLLKLVNQKQNGDSTNQKDDESQTGIRVSPAKMGMCLLSEKNWDLSTIKLRFHLDLT